LDIIDQDKQGYFKKYNFQRNSIYLISSCLFFSMKGGGTAYPMFGCLGIAVVQTKPKAPDPIRTPKLSDFRHG
jgi:hypothetical protein